MSRREPWTAGRRGVGGQWQDLCDHVALDRPVSPDVERERSGDDQYGEHQGAKGGKGRLPEPLAGREIEENLWRAIRWGMDGEMIDWRGDSGLIPTRLAVERLVEWTAPARAALGADAPEIGPNGAQRAREAVAAGAAIADVYREAIAETRRTYVPELAPAG